MTTYQTLVLTPNELLACIEHLRKELIRIGLTYGFNDERTIIYSQELDFFIFEYQKVTILYNKSL